MDKDWLKKAQAEILEEFANELKQQEQSRLDGIANLHEEQALKIHMEETNAINDKRNQKKAVA
tara:strand:+ start:386 stop:574 length:189 start_codon:yes stop_codon:yes gene_type:complete